jgi:hypothetical protein
MGDDGLLLYMNKNYVPNSQGLRNLILKEMHNVPYVGNLRYHKTIATIRGQYYWPIMKKNVIDFIARCMEFQKVKFEHRHPTGLLQRLPILEWKWEIVTIYFITDLPIRARQHDSIMIVVKKLTKAAYFIPLKMIHKEVNIAKKYMKEISRLHGVLKEIVYDKDTKFTSNFWSKFFKGFGTNLNLSITYHPESNGKIEMVNQIIEEC